MINLDKKNEIEGKTRVFKVVIVMERMKLIKKSSYIGK